MGYFQILIKTSPLRNTGFIPGALITQIKCGKKEPASRPDNGSIGVPDATSINAKPGGCTLW